MLLCVFLCLSSQSSHFTQNHFVQASGQYMDEDYVNSRKIPTSQFSIISTGDKDNYPVYNAFDDNSFDSHWIAKEPNNNSFHNQIYINFKNPTKLESILYDLAFLSNGIASFPLTLKIYSTISDNLPFNLEAVFSGEKPKSDKINRILMLFNNPIYCKRIKIEFTKVTNGYPAAKKIHLLGSTKEEYLKKAVKYNTLVSKSAVFPYNDTAFLERFTIPSNEFTATSSGDDTNYNISNLFSSTSYWKSGRLNTDSFKAFISISFNKTTTLEAIVIKAYRYFSNIQLAESGYIDSGARGFPKVLNVYTSSNGNPFGLHSVFNLDNIDVWSAQFVFPSPITCDQIKLEFSEITENDRGLYASASRIRLIESTEGQYIPHPVTNQSVFSDPSGLIKIPCDKFDYVNWNGEICNSSSIHNGSYTSSVGAKARVSFVGTKVHLLVGKSINSGYVLIRIDDIPAAFINLGESRYSQLTAEIVFSLVDLPFGPHVFEIETFANSTLNINKKSSTIKTKSNINGTIVVGPHITVMPGRPIITKPTFGPIFIVPTDPLSLSKLDLLGIYVDPLPNTGGGIYGLNEFHDVVGNWTVEDKKPPVFKSNSEPASGTFEFEGTNFWLTGVRSVNSGHFSVIIDDEDPIIVNELLTSEPNVSEHPVLLYQSGDLENKRHTVKIVSTGYDIALANLFYVNIAPGVLPTQSPTPSDTTTCSPSPFPLATVSYLHMVSVTSEPKQTLIPSLSPTPKKTIIPQHPLFIIPSDSPTYEIISTGFIDSTNAEFFIDNTTEPTKAISVISQIVHVKEKSVFYSKTPLYFISSKENTRIEIEGNFSFSNIGISSDKHPTVVIKKPVNQFLSFMNRNNANEQITVLTDYEQNQNEEKNKLHFNEVFNQMGNLIINVPSSISEVLFSKIKMQYYSSLKIKHIFQNKISKEADELKLSINDELEVLDESEVDIDNLYLNGTINIYSNSKLISKKITFSEISKIEVFVKPNSEFSSPVFKFGEMENLPQKIVLKGDLNKINSVQKFSLFETENDKQRFSCNSITDRIFAQSNNEETKINENKCEDSTGSIVISLSPGFLSGDQDSGSKKFPIGGIIGIVVAFVLIVAAVILVIVFLKKRNSQSISSDGVAADENATTIESVNEKPNLTPEEENLAI